MAQTQQELTDPRVQGQHPVIDLRDDLVTLEEARKVLGVSLPTLYRYMGSGKLPFRKLAGNRLIERGALTRCKDSLSTCDERMRMQRRAAAHSLHAIYDSREVTKPARDAFLARFERAVDPEMALSPKERARRAEQARKSYFTDLARRSSKARAR